MERLQTPGENAVFVSAKALAFASYGSPEGSEVFPLSFFLETFLAEMARGKPVCAIAKMLG